MHGINDLICTSLLLFPDFVTNGGPNPPVTLASIHCAVMSSASAVYEFRGKAQFQKTYFAAVALIFRGEQVSVAHKMFFFHKTLSRSFEV